MIDYVELIKGILDVDIETIKLDMDDIKTRYGISYEEYYNNELYKLTSTQKERKVYQILQKKELRKKAFDDSIRESGLTKLQIAADVKTINSLGIRKINIFYYEKFQMYSLSEERRKHVLELLNKRDKLAKEIKNDIEKLSLGEKKYCELEPRIEELREIVDALMLPAFRKKLEEIYYSGRINDKSKDIHHILVDIELTRLLLRFSAKEYMAFHFDSKSFLDKMSYMANKERITVLSKCNNEKTCDLLDNKAESYKVLEKQFGREQVYISNINDLEIFKKFCKNKKCFVKKPLAKSMGEGVALVHIHKDTNLYELMVQILNDAGSFVAEEMIVQHECLSKFNPNSVNTVRVETYFDGRSIKLVDCFIRFGRDSAFVDNAGAGGVFAAVDPETGMIYSDAFDEYGKKYETHPVTGIKFKGFQLPKWKKAQKLAYSIGNKFEGVSFIGWDFAYTNKGKWIVVEANAKPQIICNQCSQSKGLKKAFLDKVSINDGD